MLSLKGWTLLVVSGALLVGASMLGLPEAAGLAAGCVAAIISALIMVWLPPVDTQCTLRVDPLGVPAGGSTELHIEISSRVAGPGRLLVTGALGDGRRIRAWAPAVERAQAFRFAVGVPARGPLLIGPLRVRRVGLLGLAVRTVATGRAHEVIGWPEMVACPPPAVPVIDPDAGGSPTDPFRVDELSTASLRTYQPGDDPRRIAWTASARSTEILVRVPDPLPSQPAWSIALDAPAAFPEEESFELALSIAASLVASDDRAVLQAPDGSEHTGTGALDHLARMHWAGGTAAATRPGVARPIAVMVTGPAPLGRRGVAPDPPGVLLVIRADPSGPRTSVPGERVVHVLDDLMIADSW